MILMRKVDFPGLLSINTLILVIAMLFKMYDDVTI